MEVIRRWRSYLPFDPAKSLDSWNRMVLFLITLREATSSSIIPHQDVALLCQRHNRDMPKGTLLSLLREAGFTREEMIAFLALARQLLQNLFPQLLRLAEKLLIFDEQAIQLQRLIRISSLAQDHVAHMDWVGQGRVFGEFFQRGIGIVVVHGFIVAPASRRLSGGRLAAHRAGRRPALHHLRSPQIVQVDDSQQSAVAVNHHQ